MTTFASRSHPATRPRRDPSNAQQPLLIVLGNEYRGDDAAGLLVARIVRRRCGQLIEVVESSGDAADLIDRWRDRHRVVVVDAASSDSSAARIVRFDACRSDPSGRGVRFSTHSLGLMEAIELSRLLRYLPRSLTVHAIVGRNFALGSGPTKEVARLAEAAVSGIVEDLLSPGE
jgi:hydrogenase maturation protease